MSRKRTSEAREAARNKSLWRPMSDPPDADIMVLVRVDPEDDEPYLVAAYLCGGARWCCGIGAEVVRGHKTGWMHMHDADKALSRATAGGAA